MLVFPHGIIITREEHLSLLHLESDPEQWLQGSIREKARLRKEALINEWRPRLLGDPDVVELPADANALVQLIMSRLDYKSRAQADASTLPLIPPYRHNIQKFEAQQRIGVTVVLFPTGIDITDFDCSCILAHVQDLEDWIMGALLGQINRGKKKMIAQYQPVILDDPDVPTFPADEEGLINMITARTDYKTQPEQTEIKLRH